MIPGGAGYYVDGGDRGSGDDYIHYGQVYSLIQRKLHFDKSINRFLDSADQCGTAANAVVSSHLHQALCP